MEFEIHKQIKIINEIKQNEIIEITNLNEKF